MLKLGRVTKVKVLFLVLVFVFNFDLFKFSAAILEKGLLPASNISDVNSCKDHHDKAELPDPLAVEDLISDNLNIIYKQ